MACLRGRKILELSLRAGAASTAAAAAGDAKSYRSHEVPKSTIEVDQPVNVIHETPEKRMHMDDTIAKDMPAEASSKMVPGNLIAVAKVVEVVSSDSPPQSCIKRKLEEQRQHFHNYDAESSETDSDVELDDSDRDPDYTQSEKSDDNEDEVPSMKPVQKNRLNKQRIQLASVDLARDIPATEQNSGSDNQSDTAAELNNPRKKRLRTEESRREHNLQVHALGPPCDSLKCKKGCSDSFTPERREDIRKAFWSKSYKERKSFLKERVIRKPTAHGERASRRDETFRYTLQDDVGDLHVVCKTFFLTTLGWHPKNDRAITTMIKTTEPGDLTPAPDMRGRHRPSNKINRDVVDEHIESFNPTASHYRREHAPHRRYLPSDMTITSMYEDFKSKHPDFKCSYHTYWQAVSDKNISFTKLGNEQCEVCTEYFQNLKNHGHDPQQEPPECGKCKTWREHKRRDMDSRQRYQEDATKDWAQLHTTVRSVDLQKVIMLPRMPSFKTVLFTRRIIAYHETFAAVGKRNDPNKSFQKDKNISIIWHEATAGRKAEEIAAAFHKALETDRDAEHVIYWLDNCSGQNKNWTLYSTLVTLLNTDAVNQKDITLRYFEHGHTFMSADSVHHGVEREMRKQGGENVYDFQDFQDVVARSNSGQMKVIPLKNDDFLNWQGQQSTKKLREKDRPMLSNIVEVQFRRGSRNMFYKLHGDEEYKEFEFLKKTFVFGVPGPLRPRPKGIAHSKKSTIVKKLCPLMPQSRRAFWENLEECREGELAAADSDQEMED